MATEMRPMTKADFDHIVTVIDTWAGGMSRDLGHPLFFHELGELNRVVFVDGTLVGFLLGFITPRTPPVGYVHLVGVHPDQRRGGHGRALYAEFEGCVRERGCKQVKAITTVANEASIHFHRSIGWHDEEVADYAGPGRPRVVLTKAL